MEREHLRQGRPSGGTQAPAAARCNVLLKIHGNFEFVTVVTDFLEWKTYD